MPEPQAITLEEARAEVAKRGHRITRDRGVVWWYVESADGSVIEQEDSEVEVLSVFLGVPVTKRDDTAELVEALEAVDERLANLLGALEIPMPDSLHLKGLRGSLPSVREDISAALAKWKERNDE